MGGQLAKEGQTSSSIGNNKNNRTILRIRTSNNNENRSPTSTSSSSSTNRELEASPSTSSPNNNNNIKSSQIVVVNAGPAYPSSHIASSAAAATGRHRLTTPVLRPLIPIGQTQINPSYPPLAAQPIIAIGLELEAELRANSELVSGEQSKLVEKIREIDQRTSASAITIGAERARRFNKAVEHFGRFDEIDQLISRCESDIENILTIFVQLNEALPDSLRLEPFALRV